MSDRRFAAILAALFATSALPTATAGEIEGTTRPMGAGTVGSYTVTNAGGVPVEIGVTFSAAALAGLPEDRNSTSRCFDLNGDGTIAGTGECEGDYEAILPYPEELSSRYDIPFTFAMVNWNPDGHPPDAWTEPHFDIHFYHVPLAEVEAIKLGSCGIFIDCGDFERATKLVPHRHLHGDYTSIGAAVGRMGDHLIDRKTPEFADPPMTFTRTIIFGAYDGRVTFHEVMATLTFMVNGIDNCAPIKQPEAWEQAGWYPTRYCFRHQPDGGISAYMADFVLRPAG